MRLVVEFNESGYVLTRELGASFDHIERYYLTDTHLLIKFVRQRKYFKIPLEIVRDFYEVEEG